MLQACPDVSDPRPAGHPRPQSTWQFPGLRRPSAKLSKTGNSRRSIRQGETALERFRREPIRVRAPGSAALWFLACQQSRWSCNVHAARLSELGRSTPTPAAGRMCRRAASGGRSGGPKAARSRNRAAAGPSPATCRTARSSALAGRRSRGRRREGRHSRRGHPSAEPRTGRAPAALRPGVSSTGEAAPASSPRPPPRRTPDVRVGRSVVRRPTQRRSRAPGPIKRDLIDNT